LPIKLRFKLRKLLWAIALLGVALWIARYPYFALQNDARFRARSQEALALISSYGSVKPTEIAAEDWQAAVHHVEVVWQSILPGSVYISDAELEEILNHMHKLHDRTNSFTAEGDLYSILDLLGHFNSRVPATNELYIARSTIKQELQVKTAPSTGVIRYARSLVGNESEDVFAALSNGLKLPDWQTRAMVCRALKELGLAGRRNEAIEAQQRALEDDDPLVRQIALESLAALAPESLTSIPAIDNLLRHDPSSQVRVTAAAALVELDPSGAQSVPLLAAMLRDPDSALRLFVVRALGDLGPKALAANDSLVAVIEQDEDHSFRSFACQTLSKVSPASKTVPILLEALKRERNRKATTFEGTILQTLGRIGPDAAPAVPVLVETYNSSTEEHVRGSAMIALGGIGPRAHDALPTVLEATKSSEFFVRANALEALTKITVDPDVVVPPLVAALKDKQWWTQKTAATLLGKLGPAAKAAIPALEAAMVDRSFVEPPEAARALRMIRGE
jgi:HEAT repeat protein